LDGFHWQNQSVRRDVLPRVQDERNLVPPQKASFRAAQTARNLANVRKRMIIGEILRRLRGSG
jgi:hypothetical protein